MAFGAVPVWLCTGEAWAACWFTTLGGREPPQSRRPVIVRVKGDDGWERSLNRWLILSWIIMLEGSGKDSYRPPACMGALGQGLCGHYSSTKWAYSSQSPMCTTVQCLYIVETSFYILCNGITTMQTCCFIPSNLQWQYAIYDSIISQCTFSFITPLFLHSGPLMRRGEPRPTDEHVCVPSTS